jgi:hypothetical protein
VEAPWQTIWRRRLQPRQNSPLADILADFFVEDVGRSCDSRPLAVYLFLDLMSCSGSEFVGVCVFKMRYEEVSRYCAMASLTYHRMQGGYEREKSATLCNTKSLVFRCSGIHDNPLRSRFSEKSL